MKRFLTTVACCASLSLFAQTSSIYKKGWIDFNKNGRKDVFEDPAQPVDKRVEDLLSQMTLNEKTCQLATLYGYGRVLKDELPTAGWKDSIWKDGIANIDEHLNSLPFKPEAQSQYSFPFSKHADAINTVQKWFIEQTRLGIPVDFTNEGIHGLTHDRATSLPAPISIGATWNKQLVRQAGEIVGREGKALGYTNIYAPILDPARDQRWGRTVECYGEDPFLIAELGKQMTLGIQSQGVAATIKHFAVYSVPKGGRDGEARTDPHVAPREMHLLYLYPFKRVIMEAKPLGVMSSYNDWDGVPVTGSHYFLTQLLREQYGFNGYVTSDSRAVEYIWEKHHVAQDFKEATRQAVEAGLNVWTNFDPPNAYINNVRELVKEGKMSINVVDARVRDVLRVKFIVGLFDQPYVDVKQADKLVHTPSDEAFSKEINRQSMVLLKNTNNLLPLSKTAYKNILVAGPMADATKYAISRYGPSNNPVTSVFQGIKNMLGSNVNVTYEMGCHITGDNWPESEIIYTPLTNEERAGIDKAVTAARQSDIIIAVLGEDEKTVGEGLSRTSLDLPGRQQQLLEALYATGKPVVLVMTTGQPLTINWANKFLPAILNAGFPGPSAGEAVAETLFGDYNPGGKLTMTYPKSTGQIEFNFPFKPGSHADQPPRGRNGAGFTSANGSLYPFGFGLSYTSFTYSNLVVTPAKLKSQANVEISVDITNSGSRKGDEVVQLYIKDVQGSVIPYEMQLRGFERISLQPGEKKTVKFLIQPQDLELLDKNMNWTVEPGVFEVWVGSSSEDIRLKKEFVVE
ncbi:glycoside hydrolase family 3 C-terminal domain-containing protein [Terrimonas sp. NA20]|uniref:Glycoside hydrolase family 3 C-terminal domain-containing protein n=1 Tax=Terrimonas ginsenosidimutans TaxID=2908004 RepID=A0ABS9KU59_9BACT|nr:glycoside hydrolase family 3 N-terminal domain-containing protein [Terrimonas ginsenosidimutans]MCG2615858.1 glycoside hydrolase family 3 C-terminal domain-containing protein [Terrimonas ginsenosidimutans]